MINKKRPNTISSRQRLINPQQHWYARYDPIRLAQNMFTFWIKSQGLLNPLFNQSGGPLILTPQD
jgi:hypothetical protein